MDDPEGPVDQFAQKGFVKLREEIVRGNWGRAEMGGNSEITTISPP
jgi:hypothetical protein